jgi:hydroxymethylglutaryl-CoA reductase (NADPH)
MHLTFLLLFRRSRALGSSVSLPIAILSSSFLALIVSIPIAWQIGIRMNLVELSEALPFLVCTVGFDKPMRLAKAVFGHENLLAPVQPQHSSTQNNGRRLGSLPPGTLPPPGEIILSSLQTSYSPIIRDYFLEIGVLLLGAWARVSGLSDVRSFSLLHFLSVRY